MGWNTPPLMQFLPYLIIGLMFIAIYLLPIAAIIVVIILIVRKNKKKKQLMNSLPPAPKPGSDAHYEQWKAQQQKKD